jgi:hypothetical protein
LRKDGNLEPREKEAARFPLSAELWRSMMLRRALVEVEGSQSSADCSHGTIESTVRRALRQLDLLPPRDGLDPLLGAAAPEKAVIHEI